MALDAEARRVLVQKIEDNIPEGPDRETFLFRALLGRRSIPSRRLFKESFICFENKKTLEWGPMTMNIPQRMQEAHHIVCRRNGIPERTITLKARQFGISTNKLADGIEEVIRGTHVNALLVGDQDKTSQALLEKGKTMVDKLPYQLPRRRDNRMQLAFGDPINGSLVIETAKGGNPGRGKTYKFVHATEPAFWDDAVKKIRSLNNAVPTRPETVLSWESTANGYNWFHDFFWSAWEGRNEYKAFFFPWFIDPTFDYYQEPSPAQALEILESLDDEEKHLIADGVSVGQLKWRRYAISTICLGDLDSFHQEYPSRPEEAFLSSGRPAFNGRFITAAMRSCEEPISIMEILPDEEDRVTERLRYRLNPNPKGPLRIWENPNKDCQYLISADVAEGIEGGDYSTAYVGELETGRQVAEWHGHCDPKEFGRILACLGWYYGTSWVVPEINNHGISTLDGLRGCGYPRIMRRHVFDSVGSSVTNKLGWHTNVATKPLILNEIREHLSAGENGCQFRSHELGRELLQVEIDDAGRANAPKGKHDDRVMAWGIFLRARAKAYEKEIVVEEDLQQPDNYNDPHWVAYRKELEGNQRWN